MTENLNKKPPKGILKQSSSFDTQNVPVSYTPRASVTSLGAAAPVIAEVTNNSCNSGDDLEQQMSPGGSMRKKSAKFDEMNIISTLHPADKDYGFMKIEEPKTPFNYYEEGEEGEEGGDESSSRGRRKHILTSHGELLLDPEELAEKIKEKGLEPPSILKTLEDEEDDEDEDERPVDPEKRQHFESKRKAHYNEYSAVKLARQLMEKDEEEEEDGGAGSTEETDSVTKFVPAEECVDQEDMK